MIAVFDTAYYIKKATEIEKRSEGTVKVVACRVKFVLTGAKKNHTPMLDVLDNLQDEAACGHSAYSQKLMQAVNAMRQREDLKL